MCARVCSAMNAGGGTATRPGSEAIVAEAVDLVAEEVQPLVDGDHAIAIDVQVLVRRGRGRPAYTKQA